MMNEIAKYFSVSVIKEALIKHIQIVTNVYKGEKVTPPVLDCQIYSQAPAFQLSDGWIFIDCELSESATHSLDSIGRLVGLSDARGLLVSVPKYSFKQKSRRRYVLVVDQMSVVKIEKLNIIGIPQPYYTDRSVSDYINMHQQHIERTALVDYVDPLPTIDVIIAGASAKFPATINVEERRREESTGASVSKFLDLTEDELKTLLNSPEVLPLPAPTEDKKIPPQDNNTKPKESPAKSPQQGKLKMAEWEKFTKWREIHKELKTTRPATGTECKEGRRVEFTLGSRQQPEGEEPIEDDEAAEMEPVIKQKIHDCSEDQHHE